MPFITQGKTNLTYILIVVILAVIVCGGIWFYKEKQVCLDCFGPPAGELDETANWKTYRNEEYRFEFRYPSDFTTEEKQETVEVFSPKSLCETDAAGDLQTIEATEVHIKIKRHSGTSYEQIWQDALGFGVNSYDGTKIIGGKESRYFSQGAEMLYGRTVYLVKISQTEALEINTYIPILIYRCNPPFNASPNDLHALYDQIFSTFKFLD